MKPILPIDSSLPGILDLLSENNSLILSAAPGAGKTTRLPPALLKLTNKAVWVLEPRRIAAISASQRIAEENAWQLGKEVGYQVRFENRSSSSTRLLFLTEALLLRGLIGSPNLEDVGVVVLDEFHERSLHVDLALGALKELQELSRPDLKIIVMSATINAEPLARFLGRVPVVDIPGKLFPLDIQYEDKSQLLKTGQDFTERMKKLVQRAFLENPEGDLLCFLPGKGEIDWLKQALEIWANEKQAAILPLHGQLGLNEQKAALLPLPHKRKIILSTNVAESSLTVEGVRIVVDSGLARISQLHPRTGFSSLDLTRISKASATQRAGRSGRLGPGKVYRAWIPYDELSMKEFEVPEVMRSDLSEPLLLLSALGITHFESFSWFDAPSSRALAQAKDFLRTIGAIQSDGRLTELGARIRDIPLHPRIAKLLLKGKERGMAEFAAELAAVLSESKGRISRGIEHAENDLWERWEEWRLNQGHPRNRILSKVVEQLKGILAKIPAAETKSESLPSLERLMQELIFEAYGDRLCRRRKPHEPQAKMVGGRGVKLHPESSVKASEFFIAIELSEGRDASETLVFQAIGIPAALVEEKILPKSTKGTALDWDEEKNRFFITETLEWHGISVGKEHRRPADSNEIEGKLANLALSRWDRLLAVNEALKQWVARLNFLHHADTRWPLLDETRKKEALEMASFGDTSLKSLLEKDLVPFFETVIGSDHREALNRECPAFWVVPSGSRIPILYSEEQGPQVSVRLQELFGLKSQPKIAGQPLTLSLLAPNFRPVQVTRDLESFWKNGYPEVRKEMRARYPKHSWPEDPFTALPQAKGRPRF